MERETITESKSGEMRITNPLPQRYLTDTPGVGGRIKVRPEDFLVDELPLYEPDGVGEHLYVGIEKTYVAHGELMSCLRRHYNVPERAIGFAGMKDKHGITRQVVSILLPPNTEPPKSELPHQRIKVMWTARHRNKIRLGHLAGNRFSIRIRDVDPLKAPQALKTLRVLEKDGVPNYFGSQRFGYRRNNHLVGAALLREHWRSMLTHLLGTAGTPYPPYQRQRRELFDAGNYPEAAELWTAADRSERIACTKLAQGRGLKDACTAVGGTSLSFWISALQSAVFNRVLDRRLQDGLLATLIEGDLAYKHETRGVFPATAAEIASGALPARLAAMEISPSGPLWGRDMLQPAGTVLEIEREAIEAAGMTVEQLLASKRVPEGGRRALRCLLKNPMIESGLDEHGPYIRVAFDLPRGAYATIVLREIMKCDDAELEDQTGE